MSFRDTLAALKALGDENRLRALLACSEQELCVCQITELLQLANLATLVEGPFDYDTVTGRILNHDGAARWLHRPYRGGWTLDPP